MEVIFILVPVSLVIVISALWAFVWSVRNDQFDDLEKEGYAILFDEDRQDKNVENGNVNEESSNEGGQDAPMLKRTDDKEQSEEVEPGRSK
ncbi:MAG: cbb3-type cytochrome oxidase assembly protein CcoS [Pseudomonadales bacterium]